MNDPVATRRYVREVLCMARQRKFPERLIFDNVGKLTREALTTDELASALTWNEAKGFIESTEDQEARVRPEDPPVLLWQITAEGLKREGFA